LLGLQDEFGLAYAGVGEGVGEAHQVGGAAGAAEHGSAALVLEVGPAGVAEVEGEGALAGEIFGVVEGA
jgi:hypothetical protein